MKLCKLLKLWKLLKFRYAINIYLHSDSNIENLGLYFEEYHVEGGDGAALRSTVYSKLTLGVHVGVNGCLSRTTAQANVSMAVGLYNSGWQVENQEIWHTRPLCKTTAFLLSYSDKFCRNKAFNYLSSHLLPENVH